MLFILGADYTNIYTRAYIYIYIYIYICVCVCVCVCVYVCVFGQYFLVESYLIKQYRQLLSMYFVLVLSNYCMDVMISAWIWLINLL